MLGPVLTTQCERSSEGNAGASTTLIAEIETEVLFIQAKVKPKIRSIADTLAPHSKDRSLAPRESHTREPETSLGL